MAVFYIRTYTVLLLFIFSIQLHCQASRNVVSLSRNNVRTFNTVNSDETVYYIEPFTNPAYVLGCIETRVHFSIGDFDIKFENNLDGIGGYNSKFYDTFKVFTHWFSPKTNNRETTQGSCMSPYKPIYLVVKPHVREQTFQITTKLRALDKTCCICFITGLILFYSASKLSKSVLFYYTGGTSLGIIASALILVFILSRFLPKKPVAYTVLLGGWSICAWIITKLWNNLSEIIVHYYHYVIGYLLTAGFVSFAICYRYGVVTDPRSHNIIQWTIQILALFLIYNGTQLPEVSLTIICAILLHKSIFTQNNGKKGKGSLRKLKKFRLFKWLLDNFGEPPPRKLLTDEEFHLQGQIETQKALEELRKFCHSPQCSPWKTLSTMESPKRFANFIEGGSHILDDEITLYEDDMNCSTDGESEKDSKAGGDSFMSEDDDSIEASKCDCFNQMNKSDDSITAGAMLNFNE